MVNGDRKSKGSYYEESKNKNSERRKEKTGKMLQENV